MEVFGLCLTLARCAVAPGVEDFGLCLTLGRCPGAPISGGLWSLSDLGPKEPIAPGVEDFGLWLTLDAVLCPFSEVFVTWTGRADGRSRQVKERNVQ